MPRQTPSPDHKALPDQDLGSLQSGGKPALARALATIERNPDSPATLSLLSRAHAAAQAHVIGITGPPGVGKSTLIGGVIANLRKQDRGVGVIAVDPSSQTSGGALLGDRIRLPSDPEDNGVYIRSMAARDRLGGLARLTAPTAILMRALFDVVLIETVGVGQSEIDVASICDSVVLCLQPGSGDSLQFMKAGIAEIPDIIIVTKSDMGGPARAVAADMRTALKIASSHTGWKPPVLTVSAARNEGLETFIDACDRHLSWLNEEGRLPALRDHQDRHWLSEFIREEFGRWGLKKAGDLSLAPGQTPFEQFSNLQRRILGQTLES